MLMIIKKQSYLSNFVGISHRELIPLIIYLLLAHSFIYEVFKSGKLIVPDKPKLLSLSSNFYNVLL